MNNSIISQFFVWEKTARCIDFKTIYADIAGQDPLAGLILSDIIYFWLPGRNGKYPEKIKDPNGIEWIEGSYERWWDTFRISKKQAARILPQMEELGIIQIKKMKLGVAPRLYVRINFKGFIAAWEREMSLIASEMTEEAIRQFEDWESPKQEEKPREQPLAVTEAGMLIVGKKRGKKSGLKLTPEQEAEADAFFTEQIVPAWDSRKRINKREGKEAFREAVIRAGGWSEDFAQNTLAVVQAFAEFIWAKQPDPHYLPHFKSFFNADRHLNDPMDIIASGSPKAMVPQKREQSESDFFGNVLNFLNSESENK